jgi:hypothetical protein
VVNSENLRPRLDLKQKAMYLEADVGKRFLTPFTWGCILRKAGESVYLNCD